MKYKPNTIKVDLGSYRHYWRGIRKVGKSTMYRDLLKVAFGDYKYGLLISPGNETGFKALDGIYAEEAHTWDRFVEIVDDLVENRQDNEFKMVAIDTVDELVSIAIEKTLQVHYIRKQEKVTSINAALGGYGAGPKYVQDLINKQIHRLESVNLGIVFIGHTKIRDVKEKNMEESYQQLTSNLESRYDGIFADKADIIATFYVDRNVKDGSLQSTQRYIYFRTDGFVDAGSRFKNMPERVPMTPEDYLKAFEQGVKSSFETKVTDAKIEKIKKQEVEEREKLAEKFVEEEKTKAPDGSKIPESVVELQDAIQVLLKNLDPTIKKQKGDELKAKNVNMKVKTNDNLEELKLIYNTLVSE